MRTKPKLLCMVDFELVPEVLDWLRTMADVDCITPDYNVLLNTIGEYDAYWGHVDVLVDADILCRAERLRVVATASTGTDHIDKEAPGK